MSAAVAVALLEDDPEPNENDEEGTGPDGRRKQPVSALAGFTRALVGTLAFLFKRPIRLFRPVKMSTWMGIQALAEEQRKTVTPTFVRGLIRKEGWRFVPRHILPPLALNTVIGFTLFSVYTASEARLAPLFVPRTSTFSPSTFLVPFISGSLAGGAQSLISAPLDNARLVLLRRQRLLRQSNSDSSLSRRARQRALASSKPFVGWGSLLKDAVFYSPSSKVLVPASTTSRSKLESRLEQARQWARRGWSLWGLSLTKDAVSFGIFFTIFELGREGAKQVGLAFDGVPPADDSSNSPPRKGRRSALGLSLQAFLILVAGGLAGWSFSLVARPFERARAAIFFGRATWAELDSRLKLAGQFQEDSLRHPERLIRQRRRRPRKRVSRKRGVGRSFMFARRRAERKRDLARKAHRDARDAKLAISLLNMKLARERRHPLPSAVTLVRQAMRKYGAMTFLFAPRETLQEKILVRRHSPLPQPPPPLVPSKVAGPTRLSARGRVAKEAVQGVSSGWRRGAKILSYLPPYSLGLLVYAVLSGDLT